MDILCHTNIYVHVQQDSYYQLCGDSLGDRKVPRFGSYKRKSTLTDEAQPHKRHCAGGKLKLRTKHEIILVRSRMFYSRPALDSKGNVTFGLPHIHIFNRLAKVPEALCLDILLQTIFPLQYKLHNVFSSSVDRKETVQPFKDYTLRKDIPTGRRRRPKCLSQALAQCLRQVLYKHQRCSYVETLNHYCPVTQQCVADDSAVTSSSTSRPGIHTQNHGSGTNESLRFRHASTKTKARILDQRNEILTNFATDVGDVGAFLRAILRSVLPTDLLGRKNIAQLSDNLHGFLKLRRFETCNLQNLLYRVGLDEVSWLTTSARRRSLSQTRKAEELLSELIYWIVDSFVIPVLKSHFYITESHLFRNRVLYFRHDTWRLLTEREIAKLKLTMLLEVNTTSATLTLHNRQLGFAYLRMLPKGGGTRPITNLKRRAMSKDGSRSSNKGYLLPSINSIMQSVYSVLAYECKRKPEILGFSINSVNDLHHKLKQYKSSLVQLGYTGKLYFAKVDVKSCFDTIDQDKVIEIVTRILLEDEYMLQRYCAVVPSLGKIGRKFNVRAIPAQDLEDFSVFAGEYAKHKDHVLLVDGITHQFKDRQLLLNLLKDHLTMHLIKIGKKFFKQDNGIPQGSVLSSILCNMYYADMETTTLNFMRTPESMCVRLIDDFLYLTTDRSLAERFLQTMHEGQPDYGCFVSTVKSLANFDVVAAGECVPNLVGTSEFPVKTIGSSTTRTDR